MSFQSGTGSSVRRPTDGERFAVDLRIPFLDLSQASAGVLNCFPPFWFPLQELCFRACFIVSEDSVTRQCVLELSLSNAACSLLDSVSI